LQGYLQGNAAFLLPGIYGSQLAFARHIGVFTMPVFYV
jgi:hypothetical protein